jgi:hypothetical protein
MNQVSATKAATTTMMMMDDDGEKGFSSNHNSEGIQSFVFEDGGAGRSGNVHSRMVFCGLLLGTGILVHIYGIVVFRKELLALMKKSWKYMCEKLCKRSDENNEAAAGGALNDIIFDPSEEQAANLEEPLLNNATHDE